MIKTIEVYNFIILQLRIFCPREQVEDLIQNDSIRALITAFAAAIVKYSNNE